jgi:hypothetical protein
VHGEVEAVDVRADGGACVLELRGELGLRSAGPAETALAKRLRSHARVLVDVSALRARWAPALELFRTTLVRAGGWPVARLVLFGAPPELAEQLRAARIPDVVPLARDEAGAWWLVERRPGCVTRCHPLARDPGSPRLARRLVRAAFRDWGLLGEPDDAELVTTELVTNAVEHARTACSVGLTLTRADLLVTVRDGGPGPPRRVPDPDPGSFRGRGLQVVEHLSRAWGVRAADGGGSATWAALPLEAVDRC